MRPCCACMLMLWHVYCVYYVHMWMCAFVCLFMKGAVLRSILNTTATKSGQCVIVVHVSISPICKNRNQGGRRVIPIPHDINMLVSAWARSNALNHITTSLIIGCKKIYSTCNFNGFPFHLQIRLLVQASFTWLHRVFQCDVMWCDVFCSCFAYVLHTCTHTHLLYLYVYALHSRIIILPLVKWVSFLIYTIDMFVRVRKCEFAFSYIHLYSHTNQAQYDTDCVITSEKTNKNKTSSVLIASASMCIYHRYKSSLQCHFALSNVLCLYTPNAYMRFFPYFLYLHTLDWPISQKPFHVCHFFPSSSFAFTWFLCTRI